MSRKNQSNENETTGSFLSAEKPGLVLSSAALYFVGWVEPISGYVGFRSTQPNLHYANLIVRCETQQWPTLEPSPKNLKKLRVVKASREGEIVFYSLNDENICR